MKSLRLVLALAGILALSACTRFTNGVVETPLPNDSRLIGNWQEINHEGFLAISEASPTQLRAKSFEASPCDKADHALVTRTVLRRRNYLDILSLGADAKDGLMLVTYAFDRKGRLVIRASDDEAFARAVERHQLPGEFSRGMVTNVQISASTAQLRTYLATHAKAMGAKPIVLVRLGKTSVLQCEK